jgi:ABC-type antimicrobial peptide transport system permease subunit
MSLYCGIDLHSTNHGSFALVALILAALGIYGVIAYDVARRHRELGIRLALGAQPRRLRNAMVAGSMATVAVGLAVGVAGALALTRLLESLLYGVEPADPVSLAAGAGLLAAAAFTASLPSGLRRSSAL